MRKILTVLAFAFVVAVNAFAADNLRLNQRLDYTSDSEDGPLITGDHFDAGAQPGVPNYIIIYGEGCFNSKRQAQRTVELYEKYKDRVAFVIIDLDKPRSGAQQNLVKMYYQGSIPHVVLLNKSGRAIYNSPARSGATRCLLAWMKPFNSKKVVLPETRLWQTVAYKSKGNSGYHSVAGMPASASQLHRPYPC